MLKADIMRSHSLLKLKTAGLSLLLLLIAGCYTQFLRTPDTQNELGTYSRNPSDSVLQPDSSVKKSTAQRDNRDTLIVREREICRWERDFFGDWKLKCYRTNYSSTWHRYYDYPWWYDDWQYNTSYYNRGCHCPYHRSFHPNCELCWRYCNRYYDDSRRYPSTGSGTGDTDNPENTKTPIPERRRLRTGVEESSDNNRPAPEADSPKADSNKELDTSGNSSDNQNHNYIPGYNNYEQNSTKRETTETKSSEQNSPHYENNKKEGSGKDTASSSEEKEETKPPPRRRLR